jgi:hypothetical protein
VIGGTITRGRIYWWPTNNLKLYFLKALISETYHSFGPSLDPLNWTQRNSASLCRIPLRGEVPIHCCQLYASSAAAHVILPFWSKDGDGAVLHRVFDAQPDSLHMAY